MIRNLIVILSIVGVLTLFFACEEDTSCPENQESGVMFSLVQKGPSVGNVVFYSAQLGDTIYPRSQDTLKWLPVNYGERLTRYYVFTDSAESDVVDIYHSLADPEFLSINCGFVGVSTIDSIRFSANFIDSVWIFDPLINTDVFKKNIRIYY